MTQKRTWHGWWNSNSKFTESYESSCKCWLQSCRNSRNCSSNRWSRGFHLFRDCKCVSTCPFLSAVEGCCEDTRTIVLGQRYIQPRILSLTVADAISEEKQQKQFQGKSLFSVTLILPVPAAAICLEYLLSVHSAIYITPTLKAAFLWTSISCSSAKQNGSLC